MNGQELWLRTMRIGARLGCHQRPDRSFYVRGYQFPVCARCTGVFIGQIATIVMLVLGVRLSWLWTLILCGIMGLDWGVQRIGLKESNNVRRLITGIAGGIGVCYVYFKVGILVFKFIKGLLF